MPEPSFHSPSKTMSVRGDRHTPEPFQSSPSCRNRPHVRGWLGRGGGSANCWRLPQALGREGATQGERGGRDGGEARRSEEEDERAGMEERRGGGGNGEGSSSRGGVTFHSPSARRPSGSTHDPMPVCGGPVPASHRPWKLLSMAASAASAAAGCHGAAAHRLTDPSPTPPAQRPFQR